ESPGCGLCGPSMSRGGSVEYSAPEVVMPACLRPLDGAVVLVTGARGGIGRAACVALSNAGATVIATGREEPPPDLPAKLWAVHDVTGAEDWQRVVDLAQQRLGRLDCLVNAAGTAWVESIARLTLHDWRRVSSVNV